MNPERQEWNRKATPPPSRASHTHLHAGVEGPVHLGLDIHHLTDTEERKAGGKPSRGTKGETGASESQHLSKGPRGGQAPQMPSTSVRDQGEDRYLRCPHLREEKDWQAYFKTPRT